MTDSSVEAGKIKDEPRTLCRVRRKGSAQKKKKERICEKDTEINLKEPPMAKTGTIWAINDRTGL